MGDSWGDRALSIVFNSPVEKKKKKKNLESKSKKVMWSVTSLKNESVIVKNWTPSVLITYGSSKKKYFGLSHYIAWGVFFLLSAVSSLCKDAKFGRMTQKILIWDARWRPPGCVFQQTHPSWGLTFPTPFPPDESWWKTMSQFWNNPF